MFMMTFIAAPIIAFWLVRRMMPEARRVGWVGIVFVILANLTIVFMAFRTSEHDESILGALLLALLIMPFVLALVGTFVPPGRITVGSADEQRGGPWIS